MEDMRALVSDYFPPSSGCPSPTAGVPIPYPGLQELLVFRFAASHVPFFETLGRLSPIADHHRDAESAR